MRTFRIGGSRSDFLAAVGDDGPQVACSIPAETRELTAREREIALLVAEGFSNEELANMLMLSVATVKNHVHSILKKLDVGRRWTWALGCEAHSRRQAPPYTTGPG